MLSLLFGVLIIFCGVLMAFQDAFWGLAFFALFTHIPPQQLSTAYIVPLRPALLLSLVTLLVYLFSPQYKRKFSVLPMPEMLFFFLLVVAMSFGAMAAYDSKSAWTELGTYLKYILFFLLMVNIINTQWKITWFYNVLILSAAWMVYKCWDLRGTTGPRFENLDGGIVQDANGFASALVLLLPLVAIRTAHGPLWLRLGAGVGIFGIVMSIVITGSRSGFLGLFVSMLSLIYLFPKIRMRLLTTCVILAFSLSFVPYVQEYYLPRIKDVFSSEKMKEDGSAQSRLTSWSLSIDVWKENLVFGCGLKNFGYYMGYMEEGKDWGVRGHVTHNLYLQTLSETGAVGSLGLLGLIVCFFARTTRARKQYDLAGKMENGHQVRVLQIGMAGFLISAIFQNRLMYEPIYWWVALSIVHSKLSRRIEHATA